LSFIIELMDNERYNRGWKTLKQLDEKAAEQVMANLREIAPDFATYAVEFPFGDLYARPDLDLKTREIVAVAALTALGYATPQLKFHIGAALNAGCSRKEVVEILMQTVVYAGFPAALNGLAAAKEVFKERDTAAGAR
jgi:4-carboxymuconolactone decarboxylase